MPADDAGPSYEVNQAIKFLVNACGLYCDGELRDFSLGQQLEESAAGFDDAVVELVTDEDKDDEEAEDPPRRRRLALVQCKHVNKSPPPPLTHKLILGPKDERRLKLSKLYEDFCRLLRRQQSKEGRFHTCEITHLVFLTNRGIDPSLCSGDEDSLLERATLEDQIRKVLLGNEDLAEEVYSFRQMEITKLFQLVGLENEVAKQDIRCLGRELALALLFRKFNATPLVKKYIRIVERMIIHNQKKEGFYRIDLDACQDVSKELYEVLIKDLCRGVRAHKLAEYKSIRHILKKNLPPAHSLETDKGLKLLLFEEEKFKDWLHEKELPVQEISRLVIHANSLKEKLAFRKITKKSEREREVTECMEKGKLDFKAELVMRCVNDATEESVQKFFAKLVLVMNSDSNESLNKKLEEDLNQIGVSHKKLKTAVIPYRSGTSEGKEEADHGRRTISASGIIANGKIQLQGDLINFAEADSDAGSVLYNSIPLLDTATLLKFFVGDWPSIGTQIPAQSPGIIERRIFRIFPEQEELVNERMLMDNTEGNLAFITAEPGMGKSTQLHMLARMLKSKGGKNHFSLVLLWNTKVFLEHARHKDDMNVRALLENSQHDSFVEKAVGQNLSNVICLVDGLDEATFPNDYVRLRSLVISLSRLGLGKIILTGRKSVECLFKPINNCSWYRLAPFTEKEKTTFLLSQWTPFAENFDRRRRATLLTSPRNVAGPNLDDFVSECLDLCDRQSLTDVIGIPLLLAICKVAFIPDLVNFLRRGESGLKQKVLDIPKLFYVFIEEKWEVYKNKYIPDTTNIANLQSMVKKHFYSLHEHLAYQELYCSNIDLVLPSLYDLKGNYSLLAIDETQIKLIKEYGIIKDIIPPLPSNPVGPKNYWQFQFQHRTFAEYFMARYLYNSLLSTAEVSQMKSVHSSPISAISAARKLLLLPIIERNFAFLVYFFDWLGADNSEVHTATLTGNMETLERFKDQDKLWQQDSLGRLPLHLALKKPNVAAIELLLQTDRAAKGNVFFPKPGNLDHLGAGPIDYLNPEKLREVTGSSHFCHQRWRHSFRHISLDEASHLKWEEEGQEATLDVKLCKNKMSIMVIPAIEGSPVMGQELLKQYFGRNMAGNLRDLHTVTEFRGLQVTYQGSDTDSEEQELNWSTALWVPMQAPDGDGAMPQVTKHVSVVLNKYGASQSCPFVVMETCEACRLVQLEELGLDRLPERWVRRLTDSQLLLWLSGAVYANVDSKVKPETAPGRIQH